VNEAAFRAALAQSRAISGWLTESQSRILFEAAVSLRPGEVALEIGSHHGKSTVLLARALPAGASLVAVDPFEDSRWGGGRHALEIFQENLLRAGVRGRVRLIRSTSADAVGRWPSHATVSLLYIDGAHDYRSVSTDIALWQRHLSPEGTMLIHDAFSSAGVTRAVLRHLLPNNHIVYHGSSGSLVKFKPGTPTLTSRLRLITRLAYFMRNVGVKIGLRHNSLTLVRLLGHRESGHPY
jgi:predicted O-methyltransferase YrrM